MSRFDTIGGYTYSADNFCGPCLIEVMIKHGEASPAARDMLVEDVLDQIASANAIDREDEWTFDSDDFPKVIMGDMLEDGERCGNCGGTL